MSDINERLSSLSSIESYSEDTSSTIEINDDNKTPIQLYCYEVELYLILLAYFDFILTYLFCSIVISSSFFFILFFSLHFSSSSLHTFFSSSSFLLFIFFLSSPLLLLHLSLL